MFLVFRDTEKGKRGLRSDVFLSDSGSIQDGLHTVTSVQKHIQTVCLLCCPATVCERGNEMVKQEMFNGSHCFLSLYPPFSSLLSVALDNRENLKEKLKQNTWYISFSV